MQQIKKNKIVAVALSGGVDSTAATIRLLEEGYTCFGVTMYLFDLPDDNGVLRPPAFLEEAKKVADALGIKHHIIDLRDAFKKEIMLPFAKAYLKGETPNPCVLCNRAIKYGMLLEASLKLGADLMATGHYARVNFNERSKKYELFKGLADRKDQAYVMHRLRQEQLSKIIFPLGSYKSKDEIRKLVDEKGIFTAKKKDSMGICFVPNGNYADVIETLLPGEIREGNFIDSSDKVLGRHKGIVHYTIGQKRGLGVKFDPPKFVVALRPESNEVLLGNDEETYASELVTEDFHLISNTFDELPKIVDVKMFNWGWVLKAEVVKNADGTVSFKFLKPERAPACGQHAVIYMKDQILGGGVITRIIR